MPQSTRKVQKLEASGFSKVVLKQQDLLKFLGLQSSCPTIYNLVVPFPVTQQKYYDLKGQFGKADLAVDRKRRVVWIKKKKKIAEN